MKKQFLIILTALGVIGSALYLSRPALANDLTDYPPIVQKLAEKFGLDAGEVKQVFVKHGQERHEKRQALVGEKLDEAVAQGVITKEQREALEAKKAEIRENREEIKSLSWEERKALMEKHREEIKAWAEGEEIDLEAFFGFIGGPKMGFHNRRFGEGL